VAVAVSFWPISEAIELVLISLCLPVSDQDHSPAPRVSKPTSEPTSAAIRSQVASSKAWIGVLLILVGVIAMSKLPQTSMSIGQSSPANGKPAPQFDLVPLTDSMSLARIDRVPTGKVVLLHFWGTWCAPCKIEYPQLSAMAGQWEDSDRFQFVSVSCSSRDDQTLEELKRDTLDYFDVAQISDYAYYDPHGVTRQNATKRLERKGMYFPTTMLIQQDGSIVGVWEGFSEVGVDEMHEAIGYLLNR